MVRKMTSGMTALAIFGPTAVTTPSAGWIAGPRSVVAIALRRVVFPLPDAPGHDQRLAGGDCEFDLAWVACWGGGQPVVGLRFGEQRDDSSWSRPAFATTTTTTSSVTRSPCVAGEISAREFTAELVEVVDR